MAIPGVGDMQPMGESRQSNCALWVRPGHIPDMEYLFWRRRLQGILANASDSTMLRLLAADVTELAYHIQWHAEAPHAAQESLTATANTILRDALVCKMCATDHLGTYASFVASTDALSIPDTAFGFCAFVATGFFLCHGRGKLSEMPGSLWSGMRSCLSMEI